MSEYTSIVVPYDFSAHSRAALETATDLARRLEADLHLVHVVEPPAYGYGYAAFGGGTAPVPPVDLTEVSEAALQSLREVAAAVRDFPREVVSHVVEGSGIAYVLRDFAEKIDADLIVMGTHGRTGIAHVFLGSAAERTLRSAPCPVMTVQARDEDDEFES